MTECDSMLYAYDARLIKEVLNEAIDSLSMASLKAKFAKWMRESLIKSCWI